jgi:LacI family transcriptional regulator
MANIFDVADRAGVSIKTVSRVLNTPDTVREVTRERVREAMEALDYEPSAAARELRSGRSRSIGMLFGDPSSGFQSRFHHAALRACDEAGYFLAAGLFDEDADDWDKQLSAFLARTRVESMILVPPLCDATSLHERLIERGVSFVLISPAREYTDAPSINMDDRKAAAEITEHLLALGHRRLGHISGAPGHIASVLRQEGFEAAISSCDGAETRSEWIRPGLFRFKDALDVADQMLSGPDRPTAIFAANDEMAAAVYFTANRLGLRVPEDLSVAGFDDVAIATTIWPPLTTIAQPYDAMTHAAVGELVAAKSSDSTPAQSASLTLDYRLRTRLSTAAPAST